MIIIPLQGDSITYIDEDDTFEDVINSITLRKDEPSCYIRNFGNKKIIPLSSIININGVKVDFDDKKSTFQALGSFKRKFHLPQPDDILEISKFEGSVKLKYIKVNCSKSDNGLVFHTNKGNFLINEIEKLVYIKFNQQFNKDEFLKYYLDYISINNSTV